MDARRLRLYELLKPKLGEEVAKELVLQLPAEPEVLATKPDLDVLKAQILDRMDARSAEVDARFADVDARFGQVDVRFAEILGEMNARFGEVNGRIAQLEATLTRRMVAIMGAWTVLLASTAAWASTIFG